MIMKDYRERFEGSYHTKDKEYRTKPYVEFIQQVVGAIIVTCVMIFSLIIFGA